MSKTHGAESCDVFGSATYGVEATDVSLITVAVGWLIRAGISEYACNCEAAVVNSLSFFMEITRENAAWVNRPSFRLWTVFTKSFFCSGLALV